ncbi:kinase-like protein, partial [Coniophora puteana RWD-64-598 SS2]
RRALLYGLMRLAHATSLFPQRLRLQEVELGAKIGQGGFGDVFAGQIGSAQVAVKTIVVWSHLRHPNILPFYGTFQKNDSEISFIAPLFVNGNICEYMKHNPDVASTPLILDVARGLNFLHTFKPTIVHGDIKGVSFRRYSCLCSRLK